MRQLAGDAALRAERPHRLQHRRRAAGVDDRGCRVVALEHRREQVGDVAAVPGVAVLAGEADLAAARRGRPGRPSAPRRGSRAGPGPARRGRRGAAAAAPAGAMPMPPPTRIAPAAPGASSRGSEKALPSGPLTQTRSPPQRAEPLGARPDRLEQEVEPDALSPAARRRRPRAPAAGRAARPRCSQWRSAASM